MPKSITEVFNLDPRVFEQSGALDVLLDVDSRVFIDPHLLDSATTPELRGAGAAFRRHFADLLKLLSRSQRPGDVFWRQAEELLGFPEVQGLCIGYGRESTAGSGIGRTLRRRLLQTAKEIVDVGIQDPEVFELVGLFEPDIGSDRVSDMTGRLIARHLVAFSHRVFSSFGVTGEALAFTTSQYRLPRNPFSREPVILVPQEILRPLPVAYDWSDIDLVAGHNAELRRKVNKIVGRTWRHATTRVRKGELRGALLRNPELLRDLLDQYKAKPAVGYDYRRDPDLEVTWHMVAKTLAERVSLALSLEPNPDAEAVAEVVRAICDKFREAVELHGWDSLLYRPDGNPQHESVPQRLFYGLADAYCEANNLDLSRESNAGRGPVDFKVSRGYRGRVVSEIKLSTNKRLVHGFEKQVLEYAKAEKAYRSFYVVIDVGGPGRWRQRLSLAERKARRSGKLVPEIIHVDGRWKPSASKL